MTRIKKDLSKKESKLLLWTLIQCDINPYRHYLNLPKDLVPLGCVLDHSKNLLHYVY